MPAKPKPQHQLQPDNRGAAVAIEQQLPTVVAGLDTASDRFHLFCNTGFQAHLRLPKSMDINTKRHQLHDRARTVFSILPAGTLLVCEEPLALKNGKTTRVLCLAAGAIWAAHLGCSFYWAWADVAGWKKEVIGNGNADKPMIESWVRENMKLEFDAGEPDYYDAAGLCRYGELRLGLV